MKKRIGIIFLFIVSFHVSILATDVGGIIDSDIKWALSDSPYIVTSDIVVMPGTTLDIDAGVIIKFNGFYTLRNNGGILNVNGTVNNNVVFSSNIEPLTAGSWKTILFESDSIGSIDYATIEYAETGLTIEDVSPTISNCNILNNSNTGIYISETDSQPSITNCTITYNGSYGIHGDWAGWGEKIRVSECTISNNSNSGIYNDTSGFFIEKSTISNNTHYGIKSNHSSDFYNNIINNNGTGIFSEMGYHAITYNSIIDNTIGIEIGGYPIRTTINNNSLYSNREYDIVYHGGYDDGEVDAQYNWWNTLNTTEIENRIWDIYDDVNLAGWINYEPILNAPPVAENQVPIANSGEDQIVFNEIILDGSQSQDVDGQIVEYKWTLQHQEYSAYNKIVYGMNPTVSDLEKGFWDVTLTVTDDDGASGTDTMLFSSTGTIEGEGKTTVVIIPL